jgi:FdhD/NarQ family
MGPHGFHGSLRDSCRSAPYAITAVVQKTAAMGCPILVAISAPTALAVRAAENYGITLVAVARGSSFEIFSYPDGNCRLMGAFEQLSLDPSTRPSPTCPVSQMPRRLAAFRRLPAFCIARGHAAERGPRPVRPKLQPPDRDQVGEGVSSPSSNNSTETIGHRIRRSSLGLAQLALFLPRRR